MHAPGTMSRALTIANFAALALAALAIAEAVLMRRPEMIAPPAIVALACVLAVVAARPGASFARRGWAIATNLLCTLGHGVLLVVASIGLVRGELPPRGTLVAVVLVALLWLAVANVRASVGPRPWDDAPQDR